MLLAATFLALYFRRPDQLFHPYIWVEDGTINLIQYIQHGWLYLFEPVAGYLILPAKLIQASALTLSVSYYPEIAYWLTVLFQTAVLGVIALSPTSLRMPLLCAVFTLLVPSDSEVFGTSHYAFWWGSLLLLPPLLWSREADARLWSRAGMLVLGGLSSPLVIVLAPIFVLQSLLLRTRNSTIVTFIALACAGVQAYFLRSSGTHGTSLPTSMDVAEIVRKFFGMFVYWSPATDASLPALSLILGVLLVAGLIAAAVLARHELAWRHVVLALALCASVAVSVIRVPPEVIHPIVAGPRYFFYPYIFLGWLMIELVVISRWPMAVALSVFLVAGLHQFGAYGPRGHHAMDWRGHMAACRRVVGPYPLPVHLTGNRADTWGATIPADGCRELDARSLFK